MRALAITGIETAAMIPSIMVGSLIRATPPAARMSLGTRSRAMTATAPASSAILAWSAVTTSMMTPPLSIWARPVFVAQVDVSTVMLRGTPDCRALAARRAGPGVLARSSRSGHRARSRLSHARSQGPVEASDSCAGAVGARVLVRRPRSCRLRRRPPLVPSCAGPRSCPRAPAPPRAGYHAGPRSCRIPRRMVVSTYRGNVGVDHHPWWYREHGLPRAEAGPRV